MDGRAVTRNLPLNPAKVQNQTLENDSKTKLTTTNKSHLLLSSAEMF